MIKLDRPLLFFDLETTGTDVANDRIIQIAIVKRFPDGTKETFKSLVNPLIDIAPEATEVHGITQEMVADAPTFQDIHLEIFRIFDGSDIGGFNSNRFDVPLLYAEFRRVGFRWNYLAHHYVDVYPIYVQQNPRTLEAAYAQYVGGEFDAHDALADVEATIKVLEGMISQYEDLPVSVPELHILSRGGKEMADMSGKFYVCEEGVVRFNFGPKKDEPAKDHIDLLRWMLTKDFPADTEQYVRNLLYRITNDAL